MPAVTHPRALPRSVPSIWPGVFVGAVLGAVVGIASIFVPLTSPSGPPEPSVPAASTTSEPSAVPPAQTSALTTGKPSPAPQEAEGDYLKRAEGLIAENPAEALALAEAHAERYPQSARGQEREVIAIFALSALGRDAQAKARARLFVTLFPTSEHRKRVEELLSPRE